MTRMQGGSFTAHAKYQPYAVHMIIWCLPVTCFVTSALATRSKVKGFPHCQLRQVGVCLIDVGCCSLRDELLEAVPIVGNLAMCLHSSVG